MTAHKIDKKITGYRVKEKDQPAQVQEKQIEVMHEAIKRPDIPGEYRADDRR